MASGHSKIWNSSTSNGWPLRNQLIRTTANTSAGMVPTMTASVGRLGGLGLDLVCATGFFQNNHTKKPRGAKQILRTLRQPAGCNSQDRWAGLIVTGGRLHLRRVTQRNATQKNGAKQGVVKQGVVVTGTYTKSMPGFYKSGGIKIGSLPPCFKIFTVCLRAPSAAEDINA